jgi:superfamily I DNA and/or RNA helicase/very-short-patch-repair endonuclease
MNKVVNQLEITRKELLDMGLRGNPMLSFVHNKSKTLEIVDELSEEIFNVLITCQKSMKFLPIPKGTLPEDGDETGIRLAQITEYLSESVGSDRHTDNALQTRLAADKLDLRLMKVNAEAKTYIEEQGVDILYLALGFVNWYEDVNSDRQRKAPLILIPVELRRATAKDGFKVAYTEAELGPNLTLAAKFKSDFNIVLPDFEDEFNVSEYFSAVKDSISKESRWSVAENEIALGFFSFGKFQMYKDLDGKTWPEDSQPSEHPVLTAMFDKGFTYNDYENSFPDHNKEEIINCSELCHFVYDSDPSQTEAALKAAAGNNLVIQGPPGTGKSQTITNIIADAIASNKTVLFVAEKMAALEVVKRRLDECHIGEAVLEIHSHKANKNAILDSIKKSLHQDVPVVPNRQNEIRQLQETRKQLDDYCNAVNAPILNFSATYINALGHFIRLTDELAEVEICEIPFEKLRSWDDDKITEVLNKLSEIQALLSEMGPVSNNPFNISRKTSFSPIEQQKSEKLISVTLQLIKNITSSISIIANAINVAIPQSNQETNVFINNASLAIDAPNLQGVDIKNGNWLLKKQQLQDLVKAGSAISTLDSRNKDVVLPQIYDADIFKLRNTLKTIGSKWWKVFSGEFRRAKSSLQSYCKNELSANTQDWLTLLDEVMEYQANMKVFNDAKIAGEQLFAGQWQGLSSDWDALTNLVLWMVSLHEKMEEGKSSKDIFDFLNSSHELIGQKEQLKTIQSDVNNLTLNLSDLEQIFELTSTSQFNENKSYGELNALLMMWIDSISSIYQVARYNLLLQDFSSYELIELEKSIGQWNLEPKLLSSILLFNWYQGLVNYAYGLHDAIKHFDASSHEYIQKEFKELDAQLMNFSQESLVSKLHARLPSVNAKGQIETLRKEFGKKRRHMPIRKLISKAAEGIQRIKPIFMMSPMSVATYLPQGEIEFDMVIFDEASQIKVADAMGSILRGKQTIVVGDSKQMPPTDFFGKAMMLDEVEADESMTADLESVLSLFVVGGSPESMLKTHYRSRHESLIAFSNDEFYERKLRIFPSPGTMVKAKGLIFNHNPETIYERGTSRTNPLEAQQIAQAVLKHSIEHPDLTLGVVAFSMAQREAIMLEVERLRREHNELEAFFHIAPQGEGLFVKNLENVQGDERDVIYISIGYGRTDTGKVTQSFGPLNKEGGQRRLNVLVTRARLTMVVFCNFTAEDIKVNAESSWGLKAFRNFLHFAQHGELLATNETGKIPDSPFEEEVIKVIKDLGYDVEPQVGCSGYYLDIAVRDPLHSGRYLLAVECDGASYHGSASARDRDRMRQGVLEGLGWRFHRIWSTDWFRNRKDQSVRLKNAIEVAIENQRKSEGPSSLKKPNVVKEQFTIQREEKIEIAKFSLSEYVQTDIQELPLSRNLTIYDEADENIIKALLHIINIESPIHGTLLTQRLCAFYDLSRAGAKIRSIVDLCLDTLKCSNEIEMISDFIYKTNKEVVARDRSSLSSSHRKFELVSPEEIKSVFLYVIHESISVNAKDAMLETVKYFGYSKVTALVESRFKQICVDLINAGEISNSTGDLQISK